MQAHYVGIPKCGMILVTGQEKFVKFDFVECAKLVKKQKQMVEWLGHMT